MGFVLLWLCWYSAWECGAFALRIVGFWYHESCAYTNPKRLSEGVRCPALLSFPSSASSGASRVLTFASAFGIA